VEILQQESMTSHQKAAQHFSQALKPHPTNSNKMQVAAAVQADNACMDPTA